MPSIDAGEATDSGTDGADYYVKHYGRLPDNYITTNEAKGIGWIRQEGNLDVVAPGKTIGGDKYMNKNHHLPEQYGRIWYEADINYSGGFRGDQRIVYSNDGLVFATHDHYKTFIAID
ncbi:MAG: ribonuclease [Clostridia bacterium]|nr:ribonuclease [Clostridia bacterium]